MFMSNHLLIIPFEKKKTVQNERVNEMTLQKMKKKIKAMGRELII